MAALSNFIILLETHLARRLLARATAAAALLFGLAGLHSAQAAGPIATDLQQVLNANATPKISWAKDVNGLRMVKVLIVAKSGDPDLVALRNDVIARGGAVYFRYVSVAALSAMLPASQVAAIAARSDVQGVSPNRLTARTASALEAVTGALNLRSYNGNSANYSGLDGSGVGIAVLDSGIGWSHLNLMASDGKTPRVARAVDFQKTGDATLVGAKDWTPGVDAAAALSPASAALADYEAKIDTTGKNRNDLYGHGTHVASVAAGRSGNQAKASAGLAPGARLYDVKVLDGNGYGQMSDVIAGIDWVIYHAREYNIRVLNLSLAADSTETWQTDPLARAARAAVAAGITVVAAAGNFGQTAAGGERYGTIGSPGHDPSVITVGSANTRGTLQRSDDSVNLFSSRGPTRGSFTDSHGLRQVDNLLKPDLVAPGNRVVGAIGTDKAGSSGSWSYLAETFPALTADHGGRNQRNRGQPLMSLSGT